MICPKCENEIDRVLIVSEAWQPCTLKGNIIDSYGNLEAGQTSKIECFFCGGDITDYIEE